MKKHSEEMIAPVKTVELLQFELEQCQRELDERQQRLEMMESLFAHVADAVFLTEPDGQIIDANPAACQMLGYKKTELLRMRLWDFVTNGTRDEILGLIGRLVPEMPVTVQRTYRCKSGVQKLVVLRLTRTDRDDRELIIVSNRDVTGTRRADALLAGEKRILEMLAQGHSLFAVLTALCRLFEELCNGSLTSILLLDSRTRQLWHGAAPSLPAKYTEAINGGVIGPATGSCGTAAYRGEPVIVSDIALDPLWKDYRDLALGWGLRACWSMPIFSTERKVLGTFAIYSRTPSSPTRQQHDIIGQFAQLASIAIGRTQVLEALRRSEAYLSEAQKLSRTGSFGWTVSSGKLVWSDETFRIFGCDPATKPSLKLVFRRIHPDDITLVKQTLEQAAREGTNLDFSHRLLLPGGTVKHVHIVGHALSDGPGSRELIGTVMDVTEHCRAKAALEEAFSKIQHSEIQLRGIIDVIPTLVWSACPDGSAEFFNRRWLDYTGLTMEQARDWAWTVAVHPDDRSRLVKYWQSILTSGEPGEIEVRFRHFDGTYRWFLCRGRPLRDESGKVVRWYGTNTEIEDRKRAEEALRVSERGLRMIVDNIPGMLCTMTAAGEVELANQRILDYTGKTLEALNDWSPLVHQDDRAFVIGRWTHSVETGQPYDIEHRILGADGVFRWFHARGLPLRDQGGRIVRWYVSLDDIDDRKKAEAALSKVRAELTHVTRLTIMNKLTATIAHEVNQPLTAVINNANACLALLMNDGPNLKEIRDALNEIVEDADRASAVIARIRQLAKKAPIEKSLLDLKEVIANVLALARYESATRQVTIRIELPEELPRVSGDRVQLQQVLLNLVVNGLEAMNTIEASKRVLVIGGCHEIRDGTPSVLLSVRDAGTGFQSEDVNQLFEAFHTTKPHGMGMGLSISRSIIEAHGGQLWAEPNQGAGATFLFSLPTARRTPPA